MSWSTRLSLVLTCLVALFLPTSLAIFADEAYQVDFHYALLGLPKTNSTFFHRPQLGSEASLLYTLSEQGVVGAVNPKNGQLVWRQQLPPQSSPGVLRPAHGLDVVITAQGSTASGWSAADGKLVWEQAYDGDLQDIDATLGPGAAPIAVLASRGSKSTVRRIDPLSGATFWKHEDASGDEIHRVVTTPDHVYVVSLHKALLKGLKIKVSALRIDGGQVVSEHTLDSDLSIPQDIIGITTNTETPVIAWLNAARNTIHANVLGTKAVHTLAIGSANKQSVQAAQLHATGSGKDILVNLQGTDTNWATTYRIDKSNTSIKKLWDIKAYDGHGVFSATTSTSSARDGQDQDYFVRITETEVILDSSTERLAAWPIKDWSVPGLSDRVFPVHVTSEVAVRPGPNYAVRSAVLLSSGDWILIRNGETSWTRPEQIASPVRAVWADSSSPATGAGIAEEESMPALQAVIHRIGRHVRLLQKLPGVNAMQDLVTGFFQQAFSNAGDTAFGFHKLIVLATGNGRLVVLDSGNRGKIVANIGGQKCSPELPWTKQSVPSVQEIVQCVQSSSRVEHSSKQSIFSDLRLQTEESDHFELKRAVPLTADSTPEPTTTRYTLGGGALKGVKAGAKEELWSFSPYAGFRIESVSPSTMDADPLASIGKSLGDRSVLYKYLNPNAVAVITINDQRRQAVVFLLDGVSGKVLWSTHLANVDTARPIASIMADNTLALAYTMDSIADDSVSKGHQLFVTELFESDRPDDRGNYGSLQNYSMTGADASVKPFAYSLSFHIPEEIAHLAVTKTGQGITSRMLLASLPRTNSIVGIPPQVIDARRLVGKDPTQDQMMEGLSRYTPMIDFDPRWYLTHREEVLGVETIKTAPALLESTSIVFAYGIDLFGTRVTPSFAFDILGSTFNKVQLGLTVIGLFVATFVAGPFIQKKQTNMLWQAT